MRLLLPILLIFSILHSTVFAVDEVNCSTNITATDSIHASTLSNSSDSDSTPLSSHNEQSCLEVHCHLCHCAVINKQNVEPYTPQEKLSFIFKSTLHPKGFILDILRPPIV